MKNYLELIPISAKMNRKQNQITITCISIAVFFITAIFSVSEAGLDMEITRLQSKHRDFSLNAMINSDIFQILIFVLLFLFLTVLTASVLMISGSINSNIVQRTQFFGMLRCIGMSKKQIIRYVRFEALNWCKIAIPIGITIGILFSWIICAILKIIVREEFSNISIFRVSVLGVIGGILVGIFSVLMASKKPAKKASAVPPISAVSGNTYQIREYNHKTKNSKLHIEIKLGIYHAIASKKNLFLAISSFVLSICLIFSFMVFIDLINYVMPQYHNSADLEISGTKKLIDKQISNKIANLSGVKNVFGRRNFFGINTLINDKPNIIDIISYGNFDIECLVKDHLLVTNNRIDKFLGDSSYIIADWNSNSKLKIGDIIKIGNENLEIAGILNRPQFSNEETTENRITIITSDETYVRVIGTQNYNLLNVKLVNNLDDETVEKIKNIVGNMGKINDRRDASTYGTYLAFMMFIYGFLIIVSSVTLLNIINIISLSVLAKIRQYTIMRAVGMSFKQLIRMIMAEALTYAILGSFIGIVIGIAANRILWARLIGSHYNYAIWSFPILQVVTVTCLVIGAAILATIISSKMIKKYNVYKNYK